MKVHVKLRKVRTKMGVLVSLFVTLTSLKNIGGTVDMSSKAFQYIVDELSADECRKLVASLHFVSDDLPAVLPVAEEKIPLSVSCYDLLIVWNGGKEKWQGWGKSHEIVARRLRQIGKRDLAKSLSRMVFHELAKDINTTIFNYSFEDNRSEKAIPRRKLVKNKEKSAYRLCELYDSLLWAALTGVSGLVVFSFCRVICLACKRLKVGNILQEDELQYLLGNRPANINQDS